MLLAAPPTSSAAEATCLKECLETGCIDWQNGLVQAGGTGVPASMEQNPEPEAPSAGIAVARETAQRKLLATASSIRIDATSRVSDRMTGDEAFGEGLRALVSNAAVTHQEYLSDGTVNIELSMRLTGGFAQLVLPVEIRQVDAVTAVVNSKQPITIAESAATPAAANPHTGLVIDATGIGAMPALVPGIVDESGETIYGPAFVSREFAVSRGMCAYTTSKTAALKDKRVGENPMIVRAIRPLADSRSVLVIANTDAAYLRSSAVHLEFLKACRVCIVIDTRFDEAFSNPGD